MMSGLGDGFSLDPNNVLPNMESMPHYKVVHDMFRSFLSCNSATSKAAELRKLRYYALSSERIRAVVFSQLLVKRLMEQLDNLDILDENNECLITEFINTMADFALIPGPEDFRIPALKWRRTTEKFLICLKSKPSIFGHSMCVYLANLIIRWTSGLGLMQFGRNLFIHPQILVNQRSAPTQNQWLRSDPTEGQDEDSIDDSTPLIDVEHLHIFISLLDFQDGPSLEMVAHLFFRLFTVMFDDSPDCDNAGYSRCTSILFIKRSTFQSYFAYEDNRTLFMKRINMFLQSTTNLNLVVLSLHVLALVFSIARPEHIQPCIYSALYLPVKSDIHIFDEGAKDRETPAQLVSRVREINVKLFCDTKSGHSELSLLDHLFNLTKSTQRPIIQLMACICLAILMHQGTWLYAMREMRTTRMLIPCLCRLANSSYETGDSEDAHNIPIMALLLLIRVVPTHPRFEKVATLTEELPARLVDYLKRPREIVLPDAPQDSQGWSSIGGRRLYRTIVPYDMALWSRFFLCLNPLDPSLLYAMVAIPFKQPWVDEKTFRCIVLQCIASLSSRMQRSRSKFLQHEGLYKLVMDSCLSSDKQIKLSGLICFHVLSRYMAPLSKLLAMRTVCRQVFSTFTNLLIQAAANDRQLRSVMSVSGSSNPEPLDTSGSSGGCPSATTPIYEFIPISDIDSERDRLLALPVDDMSMNSMMIKLLLGIITNLAGALGPFRPNPHYPESARLGDRDLNNSSRLLHGWEEYKAQRSVLLDESSIEVICRLTEHDNPTVVIAALWALINITYVSGFLIPVVLKHIRPSRIESLLKSENVHIHERACTFVENVLLRVEIEGEIPKRHQELLLGYVLQILEDPIGPDFSENANTRKLFRAILFGSMCSTHHHQLVSNQMIDIASSIIHIDNPDASRVVVSGFLSLNKHYSDKERWISRMRDETRAFSSVINNKEIIKNFDYMMVALIFIDIIQPVATLCGRMR